MHLKENTKPVHGRICLAIVDSYYDKAEKNAPAPKTIESIGLTWMFWKKSTMTLLLTFKKESSS